LNLQRPGEVFQKASLNAFSGLDKIDPKDGGKMKKMQEILRDMKTDV